MIRPDRGRGLVFRYLLALLVVVLFLFPIYWLFMISFKTPDEIFAHPRSGGPSPSSSPTMRCCSRMGTW